MVTSPTPQEGKTTISSSLAIVLAQTDKHVMLIDADLRLPKVHRKFGIHNRIGLTDMFMRPLDALSAFVKSVDMPGLAVITSGGLPPNLLTSHKMLQILDCLNDDFDIVTIETPPVLTVTDAAALAPATDGVILVAKPGSTKISAFQQVLNQLRSVGARDLGVVLNDVNPKSRKYGYYHNRYYSEHAYNYHTAPVAHNRRKTDKVFATEPEKLTPSEDNFFTSTYPANLNESETNKMLPPLKIKN